MAFIGCMKLLLLIFNAIFIGVGIALIGIGIWTTVEKVYVSLVIGDTLFQAASYMVISSGIVTILVCAVGLLAALKEKQRWLVVYLCLLIFSCCVLLTAAILAVVFKEEVESVMVDNMRESMIDKYGMDKDVTDAWDQLQFELECCAISESLLGQTNLYSFPYVDDTIPTTTAEEQLQDSWPIYKRTEFYKQQEGYTMKKYVPESCCKYDSGQNDYIDVKVCQTFSTGPPSNYNLNLKNDFLHYDGCYSKARNLMLNQSDIIVAMGFVFSFIMVAGMVLTYFLLRALRVEEEENLKEMRRPENRDVSRDLL